MEHRPDPDLQMSLQCAGLHNILTWRCSVCMNIYHKVLLEMHYLLLIISSCHEYTVYFQYDIQEMTEMMVAKMLKVPEKVGSNNTTIYNITQSLVSRKILLRYSSQCGMLHFSSVQLL
ncbi:hypothetical protein ATANTOWER_001424 [Ataeniobius toweri]|uniref:Uncharacterized protein n=1 Tax=Ataeniobius toweri TaxID=208326 RepID=A0ABU7BZT8_9TELE|nr:hypothetical protein [Ataeniobius toweri]